MKPSINKKSGSIVVILLLICCSFSSLNAQPIWEKTFNNYMYSSLYLNAVEDTDHGYIVAGHNFVDGNFFLIKTDINGNTLYERSIRFENIKYFVPFSTASLNSELLLTGAAEDEIQSFPYKAEYSPLIIHLNACKEVDWHVKLHELKGFTCLKAVASADGNYFCMISEFMDPEIERNIYVVKITPTGEILWMNHYTHLHAENSYVSPISLMSTPDMLPTVDGGFVINISKKLLANNNTDTVHVAYWMKAHGNGNLSWETYYTNGSSTPYTPGGGFEDINGILYSAGTQGEASYPLYENTNTGFFKFNPNINQSQVEWKEILNTNNSYAMQVLKNSPTELMVSLLQGDRPKPTLRLVKTDMQGNILNSYSYDNVVFYYKNMIRCSDGNFMVCGSLSNYPLTDEMYFPKLMKFTAELSGGSLSIEPITYDGHCNHAIHNGTMVAIINNTYSIPEPQNLDNIIPLNIYPNPTSQYITVTIPEYTITSMKLATGNTSQYRPIEGEIQISLMNISGQIVKTDIFDASEKTHVIDVSRLTPGMYMIKLNKNGNIIAKGKVVVK